jgi:serine/threonine protein kinase
MNDDICKINKKFYKKSGSSATLYQTQNNKIIKSKPVSNKNKETITLQRIKEIKNDTIRQLFSNIIEIKTCNQDIYYLMNKYDNDIDRKFLLNISTTDQLNVLTQILFGIYYFNHILHLYHNDLYYKNNIRNVMYNRIDNKIDIKYDKFNIVCEKYIIKIIDFGWTENIPAFRTTEYHNKYFRKLQIVSELVLFTYFYMITLKNNNLILSIITDLCLIIEKKLNNSHQLTPQNFDFIFYNLIINSYFSQIISDQK